MPSTDVIEDDFSWAFTDEDAARRWFERNRWPDGPECPECGPVDASWSRRLQRWVCPSCRRQFAVTSTTPMQRTHLPLLIWARAVCIIANQPPQAKLAARLAQILDITYPSAWRLEHLARTMFLTESPALAGVPDMLERAERRRLGLVVLSETGRRVRRPRDRVEQEEANLPDDPISWLHHGLG